MNMAIRVRKVDGLTIACCAAETDQEPGDLYLDDATHYALAAKFARDWRKEFISWSYPEHDAANATQVRRDAYGAHHLWQSEQREGRLRRVKRWLECRYAFRAEAG